MRRLVLSCVACLTPHFFFHIFSQMVNFLKKKANERMRVLILSTNLSEIFFTLRIIQRNIITYTHTPFYKVLVILARF
jgi:hypothetical protein